MIGHGHFDVLGTGVTTITCISHNSNHTPTYEASKKMLEQRIPGSLETSPKPKESDQVCFFQAISCSLEAFTCTTLTIRGEHELLLQILSCGVRNRSCVYVSGVARAAKGYHERKNGVGSCWAVGPCK